MASLTAPSNDTLAPSPPRSEGAKQDVSEKYASAGTESDSGSKEEKIASESQHHLSPGAGPQPAIPSSEPVYAQGWRLVLIVFSLSITVFCVAIDNTILATAVPRITDEFHTISGIGWYGSAYLLTNLSFQVTYAKFYQYLPVKWVFLTSLIIFEIGSVVSGAAPTSIALIIGRAVAGIGGAGLLVGSATASAQVAPLRLRPTIMGINGGLFGICNVLSPLIGGAFTQTTTWRWCFYINLPLGAIAAFLVMLLLDVKPPPRKLENSFWKRIGHFDPIGNVTFTGAVVSLLLALSLAPQRGFADGSIIACFVIFGVLLITWVAVQYYLDEEATVPPRVYKHRNVSFGAVFALCQGASVFLVTYYLPTWFQVVQGKTPIGSAVCMLPLVIAQSVATIGSGILTTRLGHYMPYVVASSVLVPVGIGLLTTLNQNTTIARCAGYQILFGLGVGLGFQQARVAVSVVLPFKDLALGIATVFAVQFLGGSVFVAAGQTLITETVKSKITALHIPGLDADSVFAAGAAEVAQSVAQPYRQFIVNAYNDGIIRAFRMALIMGCLMVFGTVGLEWKSVKPKKPSTGPKA